MDKEDIRFLQELRNSYWYNASEHAYTSVMYAAELKEKGDRLDKIIQKANKVVKYIAIHESGIRKYFYSIEEVQVYFGCTSVTVYNILKMGEVIKQGKFKGWKLQKGVEYHEKQTN